MNETPSRVLAALQALVIMAPLTLLAVFYLAFLVALLWETHDLMPWYGYAVPPLVLAALGCLLCLWNAVLAFASRGRAGLAKVDRRAIAAIHLGGWIAVFGVACALAAHRLALPNPFALFEVFAYGAPAILPAVHMAIERHGSASLHAPHPKVGPSDP